MNNRWKWIMLGGTAVMLLGCFMPWLSRNGVSIQGFGVESFGYPALIILVMSCLFGLGVFLRKFHSNWISWPLFVIGFILVLNLWRAYKLSAISFGLPLIVLGLAIAAWGLFRQNRS